MCVCVGMLVVLCVSDMMCGGFVSFKVGGGECVSFIGVCVWCS